MKTILVTGGAGFIGSHLCKRLAIEHRVISLDNYFAGSRANHVPGVEYREGHTKDIENLVPESIDLIYHLGEYARVEQSLLEPDVVHDLNTVGTLGVIAFWKNRGVKLVYAGSSTKFGDKGLARHTTPYAMTKAANTELVKATGDRGRLPYAITYFYNVYGPGERAGVYGTVIELFKQMYLAGAPLGVVSPGTQTRNFTHVEDIVDGLIVVGEHGAGDEYGLGNEQSFSILDVAKLFLPAPRDGASRQAGDAEITMLPERAGNRMESAIDTYRTRQLGWEPKRSLKEYIHAFTAAHKRGALREKRVLVISTTFHPIAGPAEDALLALMQKMPDVFFDIITTKFSASAASAPSPLTNARIHRVGISRPIDKFLLPFLGCVKGMALHVTHRYLFIWSLMASYAALGGVFLKQLTGLSLLITLADQNLARLSPLARIALPLVLSDADQIYGMSRAQEQLAEHASGHPLTRASLGMGDAFANQLRYAYAEILLGYAKKRS